MGILGRPSIGLVICQKRMESILEILGEPSIGSGERLPIDGANNWGSN